MFDYLNIFFFRMDSSTPTVYIPMIPHHCNVVVFPSPYKDSDKSWFYVLENTAAVTGISARKTAFDYIPGSVYCFLPSDDEFTGRVRVFSSKPHFLDKFSYCLEINQQVLDFENTKQNCSPKKDVTVSERCNKCFILHFPSPNMFLCKWKNVHFCIHYPCGI